MSTDENIFEKVHGLLRQADDLLVKMGDGVPAIEADILKEQLRGMYAALLTKAGSDSAPRHTDSPAAEKTVAEVLAPTGRDAKAGEGLYAPAEPEPAPSPAMRPMMEQLEGNPFDNLFDESAPRFVDTPVAPEPPARPVAVKPVVESPAKPKAEDGAKPTPAAPKAVDAGKHEAAEVSGKKPHETEGDSSHTGQGNGITLMDLLRQSSGAGASATKKQEAASNVQPQTAVADSPAMNRQATEAGVQRPAAEPVNTPAAPRKPVETSTPRPVAEATNAPITLADKLGLNSTVEAQVGTKVSHSKVSDLRTIININDKFSFMSELFHNNMKAYNDFILRLNAINDRQAALEHVQLIAQEFQWDMESLAVKTFYSIFDRKF